MVRGETDISDFLHTYYFIIRDSTLRGSATGRGALGWYMYNMYMHRPSVGVSRDVGC